MLVIEKVIFDASHSHEPKSLSQTESENLSEEKHLGEFYLLKQRNNLI